MLLLRKACEDILTREDLGDLHVARQNDTGYMALVGPCGQTITVISGIHLPSRMTDAAREYARDLFDRFAIKNGAQIKKVVTARKTFKSTIEPESKLGIMWIDGSNSYRSAKLSAGSVVYVYLQTTSKMTMYIQEDPTPQQVVKELTLENIKTATKDLTTFLDYRKRKDDIDKDFRNLGACSI